MVDDVRFAVGDRVRFSPDVATIRIRGKTGTVTGFVNRDPTAPYVKMDDPADGPEPGRPSDGREHFNEWTCTDPFYYLERAGNALLPPSREPAVIEAWLAQP